MSTTVWSRWTGLLVAMGMLSTTSAWSEVEQADDGSQCNALDQVEYHAIDPERRRNIGLGRAEFAEVERIIAALSGATEIRSPQRTGRAVVVVESAGTDERRATIHVLTTSPERRAATITIRDFGRDVSAQFINEKLLFVTVWWGRVVASDLLLDIESGTWIYEQDADHYSMTLSSCP